MFLLSFAGFLFYNLDKVVNLSLSPSVSTLQVALGSAFMLYIRYSEQSEYLCKTNSIDLALT